MKRGFGRSSRGLLLASATAFALGSGKAQDGFLHPVTPAEAKSLGSRLNRSLLPSHSDHVEVEEKQVFRLSAAGHEELLLMPVLFWHWEPSGLDKTGTPRNRCGVFTMAANGSHQTFAWTVTGKDDWAVDQCGELRAVRRQAHNGPRPQLTLTYRTFAPPRFEDTFYVGLTWNAKQGSYLVSSSSEADSANP